MINQAIQDALNKQINEEMYSSYLYLQMSAWFDSLNLPGFAVWMQAQSQEETVHAMKIYRYVLDRGGKVSLAAIAEPPTEWQSPLAAFEAALGHERHITGCFDKLVDVACEQKDNATGIFLQWFVTEQVEEEANADLIVEKLKMVGESSQGLLVLDRELGARGAAGEAEAGE